MLIGILLAGVTMMSHGHICMSDNYIEANIELAKKNKLDDINDMLISCIGTDNPLLYRTIISFWMDKSIVVNNMSIYKRNENVLLLIKALILSNSKENHSIFLSRMYGEGNSVVKKNEKLEMCWKNASHHQDKIVDCYYQSKELLSLPYIPLAEWHTQSQSNQPSHP